jgi:hypothetical protein
MLSVIVLSVVVLGVVAPNDYQPIQFLISKVDNFRNGATTLSRTTLTITTPSIGCTCHNNTQHIDQIATNSLCYK